MNKLLKSVLKTVIYVLDQAEDVGNDVRKRVSRTVDRTNDRVSDLRDQAKDLYSDENQTFRNILTFAAGLGVGVAAAMLFSPASGEEIRSQIGEKVHDIGGRVRDRFSSESHRSATGTEGV
jgi:gas vesicle protein